VKEFYLEKALEEQRLERLTEKAQISYFPANFKQNKDRAKEENNWLLQAAGFFDNTEDDGQYSDYEEGGGGDHGFSHHGTGYHTRRSSVAATAHIMRLNNTGSEGRRRSPTQDSQDFSSQEIMAAVAAVSGMSGASFSRNAPSAAEAGATGTTRKGSKDGQMASHGRLSLKMERMLSRRGSYNPTEIRLQLLESIHDQVTKEFC
jgi:hypothetical protein